MHELEVRRKLLDSQGKFGIGKIGRAGVVEDVPLHAREVREPVVFQELRSSVAQVVEFFRNFSVVLDVGGVDQRHDVPLHGLVEAVAKVTPCKDLVMFVVKVKGQMIVALT